jgi:hypothetical protein
MKRPPLKAKRDMNEQTLFKILRDYKIQVHPMDQPVDAICAFKGVNYLVEIKNGKAGRLTEPQIKFIYEWCGQVVVLSNEDDTHRWAGSIVNAKRS